MTESDLSGGHIGLPKCTVEEMLSSQPNNESIGGILSRHQLRYSGLSVENIVDGIQIFNGIKTNTPFAYIIYGSTSRGDAGKNPKVQELQLWKAGVFCGSIFRRYGVSDLDLRCVTASPQEVFRGLSCFKDSSAFAKKPVGIRIDSLSYASEEIVDTSITSFYRRLLLLNKPIILSGWNIISDLIDVGLPYLNPNDISYEYEFRRAKEFLNTATNDKSVVFINDQELSARFPKYYDPRYLSHTNLQRGNTFKVSFGSRESSLVTIPIASDDEIDMFTDVIALHPESPFTDIREYAKHDN